MACVAGLAEQNGSHAGLAALPACGVGGSPMAMSRKVITKFSTSRSKSFGARLCSYSRR